MTLPTTTILPLHSEKIKEGGDQLDAYMRELVFSLQSQYEELAVAINGSTKRSVDEGNVKWEPIVVDSLGGITFTYNHKIGTVLRQGLMVDIFFDVKWSGVDTGTITSGKMEIELPYKVAVSSQKPFVGVVQPSIFTFTAGTECVINAEPDSYKLEVWNTGDAFTTAQQGSVSAGHLIGNIRYVGQAIERSRS